ncbi:MAG: polyprenyl synthetase family protein [Nostocoides sp.]
MDPFDAADLRPRVQACLEAELVHQRTVLADLGPDIADLVDVIGTLLRGGKRLRAGFLYWGYRAAGGRDSAALIRAASAMEMFQAAALIHDDVMDDSDTRRGQPAAHRTLAAWHTDRAWGGDADRFGLAGAILAGNLCLNWTEELYATSGLPAYELARGREVFDRMRTQLMAGQFLDMVESVRPWDSTQVTDRVARSRRVITYKSAKYSIEHPLLIGASAGGLPSTELAGLSAYGLDLGTAFQLRDDLLGVFGDPETTGKPAGDDLREGKRTVLLAYALDGADASGRAALSAGVGAADLDEHGVDALRTIMVASGAVARVESDIAELTIRARSALATLDGLDETAAAALDALIGLTTARQA